MTKTCWTRLVYGIVAIVVTGTCGCASSKSSQSFAAPPVVGAKDLADPEARAKYANAYWKRHDVPLLRPYNYKSVAIAEFAVEFVTQKMEESKKLDVVYPQYLVNSLPDELYAAFVKELKDRGLTVTDTNDVFRSRPYMRFKVSRVLESVKMSNDAGAASDTGRIKQLAIYSISGLGVIEGAGGADIESVEAELLEELNVDVILRIRIRVGVLDGHASMDRGSIIWVLSRHVAGNLIADRSLVSDIQVIDTEKNPMMQSRSVNVSVSRYSAAMRELFDALIGMAFLSAESGQASLSSSP